MDPKARWQPEVAPGMIPGPNRLDPIRTDTDYNFYKLYYLMDPKAR